jgi:hypothetical protein
MFDPASDHRGRDGADHYFPLRRPPRDHTAIAVAS